MHESLCDTNIAFNSRNESLKKNFSNYRFSWKFLRMREFFNCKNSILINFFFSYQWQLEDHSLLVNNGYSASHSLDYIGPPEPKRRLVSSEALLHFETSQLVGQHPTQSVTPGYYYPVIPRNEARAIVLEDENALLRKKIEELKKQVRSINVIFDLIK